MKEAIEFLRRHTDIAFATIGQDKKPKLRVFQIMGIEEDKNSLYFVTSKEKEVYSQVMSNPHVEILAMEGDISVRASGMVSFDVTTSEAIAIYESSAILQNLYKDYRKLEYFRVLMDNIEYYDLSSNPPTQENYTL